jgi:Na+-transporting NADH:ubiquinone oxidoreductase subunit NqrC
MPLLSVFAVMVFCGVLVSGVNFYLAESKTEPRLQLYQHMIVGVAAALIVPLFLNMISSRILDQILAPGASEPNYNKLLVLAGFCLVAAISSRAFISSMTDRVLQEAKEARKEAKEAKENAADAKSAVDAVLDEASEPDEKETEVVARVDRARADAPQLSNDEAAVLRTMRDSKYPMRALSGIWREANIEEQAALEALRSLKAKELVELRNTSKGFTKWFLTAAGHGAANAV